MRVVSLLNSGAHVNTVSGEVCCIISPCCTSARITVIGFCVSLSVRHCEFSHCTRLSVQVKIPTGSVQYARHFECDVFTSFKSNAVIYNVHMLVASGPFTSSHLDGGFYGCLNV